MKKHWTQTEEGRERMSQIQKKLHEKKQDKKVDLSAAPTRHRDKTLTIQHGNWKIKVSKNSITLE